MPADPNSQPQGPTARVDFYHLTRLPLERALPQIAEKVLASGARLLIVGDDAGQRAMLDALLWSYGAETFLPHAQQGGGNDGAQPILLSSDLTPANGATHVALVDGVWRDGALAFERTFHFFDAAAIDGARSAWRELANRPEVDRRYWKQDESGRWQQAA